MQFIPRIMKKYVKIPLILSVDFSVSGRFGLWTFRFADVFHYDDVMMSAMGSQITSFTIVYSTIYSGADQRKQQSSASLAFVRGIHRSLVNSPHKGPVTQKMFPFDDVIMDVFVVGVVVCRRCDQLPIMIYVGTSAAVFD